jgi:aromatic ring-cleaving dioxygenase
MNARHALHFGIRSEEMTLVMLGASPPRKRVPAKVMWYAPVIPRLKRLFRNKEHAKLLRWHQEDRKSDGVLRHPVGGSRWRKIDREFKDFAGDAMNLRFGLSTYGMNPFGEKSSSHSTWPVTMHL